MPARKSAVKTPSQKRAAAGPLMRIRVTLRYTEPPVWREFLVSPEMNLSDFSDMLIRGMGWMGGHMHEIRKGRTSYRPANPFGLDDDELDDELKDASKFSLSTVLEKKGSTCHWTYDFGDSWEHEIKVMETGVEWNGGVPCCTDGARACPPEDCGGIPGYENLCSAMKDRKHPERAGLIDWLGAKFDPEAFSAEEVNARLC